MRSHIGKRGNWKNVFTSVLGAALALGSLSTEARAEWGTYQANASHNGYVPGTVSSGVPSVLWTTPLGVSQGSLTDLSVGGGNVYVSSSTYFGPGSPNVFALNAANGSLAWSQATGSNFSVNAPAYSNGLVYVQTDEETTGTYVWGFNSTTGAVQIKTPLDAQWEHYLNPTVYNGSVYMDGGHYGGMYSVAAGTGTVQWFGFVPQYDGWTPAVNANYCYAFTGSGDTVPITGKFTILNRLTGATVSVTTDNGFYWSGYTMNEAVALGTSNDAFVTNGNRILKFGTTAAGGLLWGLTDKYSGQVSVANGVVYVADGTALKALSEADGSGVWSWTPADGQALLGRSIVTDNLLLTSTGSDLYAINLATGTTAWSLPVAGNLALSDGVLYVATYSGSVSAIAMPEPGLGILMIAAGVVALRRRRGIGA